MPQIRSLKYEMYCCIFTMTSVMTFGFMSRISECRRVTCCNLQLRMDANRRKSICFGCESDKNQIHDKQVYRKMENES